MTSKTILLVCNTGMSSSFLVSKLLETIAQRGLDIRLSAVSATEAERKLKTTHIDYILLSPQVRYLKQKFEELAEDQSLTIKLIDQADFGEMNTHKILKEWM